MKTVSLHTTVLMLMTLCCITMGMLQPYGPRMCDELAKRSNRSTIFHVQCLTCLMNHTLKDSARDKTNVWKSIAVTTKCKECDFGKFGKCCVNRHQCDYEKSDCLEGSCSCVIGYSYNYSVGRCVKRCSKYGEDFSSYAHSGIKDCNFKAMNFTSTDKCTEACRQEASCTNVEYRVGRGDCNLCDTVWTSLGYDQRQAGTATKYTLYYRHCLKEGSIFN